MCDRLSKSPAWADANRLLGALAASVGNAIESRLGDGVEPDDWQERAAIMEHDGGLPRAAAEAFARELAALGPAPSPEALAALDARLRAMDARRVSSRPKPSERRP
jgi:hypothetical protein